MYLTTCCLAIANNTRLEAPQGLWPDWPLRWSPKDYLAMVGTQHTCEGWMTKWLSAPALGQDFKHDILKESSSWNCHACKSLEIEQIFLMKSAIISWEPFTWFCEEVWIKFPVVENFLSSWGTFLIKHFWSKHIMKSNLFLCLCMRVCTRVSTWSRRRLLIFFLDLLSPT